MHARNWRIILARLVELAKGTSAVTALVVAVPVLADEPVGANDAMFEAIREADSLMAEIGYRLATANAPLCDRLEAGFGFVLHTPEQYARGLRDDAIRHFTFNGPVGVEAVLPASPAARAGIESDDTIFSAGTAQFPKRDLDGEASTQALIEASARIAALPVDGPVAIRGQRDGRDYVRSIHPVPACRTRFELTISPDFIANADGTMVQISSRFFEEYPAGLAAAVVAHELAHNILRHRERLEKKGVSYGILSGLGRNVRYFRQTELEADILSVSLLANAGYDPAVAARFWETYGANHSGGLLSSRSHPAWQDRLALIKQVIADLGPQRPARPAILEARAQPLNGDWQSLLKAGSGN